MTDRRSEPLPPDWAIWLDMVATNQWREYVTPAQQAAARLLLDTLHPRESRLNSGAARTTKVGDQLTIANGEHGVVLAVERWLVVRVEGGGLRRVCDGKTMCGSSVEYEATQDGGEDLDAWIVSRMTRLRLAATEWESSKDIIASAIEVSDEVIRRIDERRIASAPNPRFRNVLDTELGLERAERCPECGGPGGSHGENCLAKARNT